MTHTLPQGRFADIGEGADPSELRVHYHEAGPADGPAVVFLHGSGPGASGYSNFKGNFRALAEHGYRCLVPDALGYGYSSKPEDAQYTLGFLTRATVRFLDAAGVDRCVLVGNSLGGAMAIRLALDHPERVAGLVLMAPGGLEEREVYMEMRGIRRMLRCIFGPEGITAEGLGRVFELQLFGGAAMLDADTMAERLQIAETQPRAVFETSRVPNQAERLGSLSCPLIAFWGMEDQFCPPTGAATIAQACRGPDVTVVTMSQCGHWVMVEERERFNRQTAAFLAGLRRW